jgi:hypothetical protein
VSFSLSPQATWWLEVREGAAGPTYRDAARAPSTIGLVVLGVDIAAVSTTVVVTDGEAAEALVPGPVSMGAVANDRRRNEVRSLLELAGVTAEVAVYPPWFVAVLDD